MSSESRECLELQGIRVVSVVSRVKGLVKFINRLPTHSSPFGFRGELLLFSLLGCPPLTMLLDLSGR